MPPTVTDPATPAPSMSVRPVDAGLEIVLAGDWVIGAAPAGIAEALEAVAALPGGARIRFQAEAVRRWDSSFLATLLRLDESAREREVAIETDGLPQGARRLLALAGAVPEQPDVQRETEERDFIDRLGEASYDTWHAGRDFIEFVGEVALSFTRWVRGIAQFRGRDLALLIQQAGPEALGVVALVNFLLGLILAFVGAAQLEEFGATLYVANLVGIAMVRDMAAVMTVTRLSFSMAW